MDLKISAILLTLILYSCSIQECSASKILMLIPLTTVSEQNIYTPLSNALVARGHELTVITRKMPFATPAGARTVLIQNMEKYVITSGSPIESREYGWRILFNFEYDYMEYGCHIVYKDPQFLPVFQEQKFDLIITNTWFHNCFFGVFHKFQNGVPLIQISTLPLGGYFHDIIGARMPTSFVPNSYFSVTDKMSFEERWWNTVLDYYFTFYYKLVFLPAMDKIAREYLGEDVPRAIDIERNVSLIFSNTHVLLTPPRPLLPNIVEIAGLHCRPAKPLPKDLDEFLSGAEHGFIYFSMGSIIQGHMMPQHFKEMFVRVFSKLKQRVLWKYEVDELEQLGLKLPPNMKVSKWLPQQDVLGHKNIRAFITHAGMFSTLEATYHGVPLIGLPIFIDQNMNMHQAAERGFAIPLEILDLTEESFSNALNEILTNKTFKEKAKEVSDLFRNQIETPIERAVYWTEYIIKHKGAPFLRSASRDLNFFQYHSLDVLLSIIMTILVAVYIAVKAVAFICHIVFHKGKKESRNSSKFVKKVQ